MKKKKKKKKTSCRYVSIEGQGHFFTIYFTCFVYFVLYRAKISVERLQDHWSSGNLILFIFAGNELT